MTRANRATMLAASDLITACATGQPEEYQRLASELAESTDSQNALLAVAMRAAGLANGYGDRRDWEVQVMKEGALFGGADGER